MIRAGGGRVGESFAVDRRERMSIGRRPDAEVFLDDVTVSRDHALLVRRGEQWYLDDCGSLNGTYVNRSRIESQRLAGGRRGADRQVQADVPRALMATRIAPADVAELQDELALEAAAGAGTGGAGGVRQKSITIGAVCKALVQEFPDISISKIRYLEDQKLLTPRRTPGGYRLYTPGRRRAPAHDPADAARRVPAAARDPPGAGGGTRGGERA